MLALIDLSRLEQTVRSIREFIGGGGVTEVVPVELGGTGATNADDARKNLNASVAGHTHAISSVTNLQNALDGKLNLIGGEMTGSILWDQSCKWMEANTGKACVNCYDSKGTDPYWKNGFNALFRYQTETGVFCLGGLGLDDCLTVTYTSNETIDSGKNAIDYRFNFGKDGKCNCNQFMSNHVAHYTKGENPDGYGLHLNNSDIIGVNALYISDSVNTSTEGIFFPITGGANWNRIYALDDGFYFTTIDGKNHKVYHDGTALPTGGADYSELFHWKDDNPKQENRDGLFVSLDGEEVSIYNGTGRVIGIVSDSPSIIGGALVDGFDLHKEPSYAIVGMMGKLILHDDGSCVVNACVAPSEHGWGTYTEEETRWICMKRIDDHTIKVLMR